MLTLRRNVPRQDVSLLSAGGRPVLLATLEVPFDEAAATFAVDAAVECGQPLIVANVVEIPLGPMCVMMGYGGARARRGGRCEPAGTGGARAPLRRRGRAAARAEPPSRCTRSSSCTWPSAAPGLLVFGPDRTKVSRGFTARL